ncbi:hypothetical protein QNI16_21500 [Cytophagaceae bacterium YF14B1]|uniref:Uncharacterized protein n=1 Tax=Xanthocytophaga flava TaxID=3048013 RepID=A0AAE3U7N3_9BACT|nr:hypothetical protein [Xanthocytophaga flavus]MDJ1483089.1 hypothetical protein [Xanthocytophaga flavus]
MTAEEVIDQHGLKIVLFFIGCIVLSMVTYHLKPSWFNFLKSTTIADHYKYLETQIDPMELKAVIIKKHQIKFGGRYFDALQLNNQGQISDLSTTNHALDQLYNQAQVNNSVLKEKGKRIFVLVHKGEQTKYEHY